MGGRFRRSTRASSHGSVRRPSGASALCARSLAWLCTLVLCAVCACESRPEVSFCREVQACEQAELLLSAEVCGELVAGALARQPIGCQRCATSLRCEAIESILAGKRKLRDICGACGEDVEVPVAEGAPRVLLTSAIAYRPVDAGVATLEEDELGTQAAAICKHGESCDGVSLLVTPAECAVQVAGSLATRELACRRCASALSCAGARAVVSGQQTLASLCPACGEALDTQRASRPPGPGGPYLVIPAIVALPSEVPTVAADAPQLTAAAVDRRPATSAEGGAPPGASAAGLGSGPGRDEVRLKAPAAVPPIPVSPPR